MLSISTLVLGLAATAYADPLPHQARRVSTLTSIGVSFPTDDSKISAELSLLNGMPTFASDVASVLSTAIPTSWLKDNYGCDSTVPSWYSPLPTNVKTALSSYAAALEYYLSVHESEISVLEEENFTIPPGYTSHAFNALCITAVDDSVATTTTNVQATSSGSAAITSVTRTSTATTTSSSSFSGTGSGTASGSSTRTGSSTTASGTAASVSGSQAAAPRATGPIVVSFAGLVGVLGLIIAL